MREPQTALVDLNFVFMNLKVFTEQLGRRTIVSEEKLKKEKKTIAQENKELHLPLVQSNNFNQTKHVRLSLSMKVDGSLNR